MNVTVPRLKTALAALSLLTGAACRHESAPPPPARAEDAAPLARDADAAALVPLARHITQRATFPLADVTLTIDDLHMSARLDDVLTRSAATLAINGAFFDERGEPVGLAVSEGRPLSRFSPTMSGGVLWIRDGLAHLTATEDYREPAVDFAVQCRPRLVVGSQVNIRSDDGRHAARTAICLRDGGRSLEVVIARSDHGDGGPTLLQLARELLADGCEEALNLDGGPSTAWASREAGGELPARPGEGVIFSPPAAPVRHAIVVKRR